MDSDSDSNSSVHSSEAAAFHSSTTIPPSPNPDDPQFERGPRGEQFLIVNHTANQRNGSEVSKIWFHGGERRRIDNGSNDRYWRCGHCKQTGGSVREATYPTLYQYALDTLSCPATSSECERVFSSTKKLLIPERNQLAEDIIEACECLKA